MGRKESREEETEDRRTNKEGEGEKKRRGK